VDEADLCGTADINTDTVTLKKENFYDSFWINYHDNFMEALCGK